MPKHFAEFLTSGGSSPGVFLVKQRTPLAEVIEELVGLGGLRAQGLDEPNPRDPAALKRLQNISTTAVDFGRRAGNRAHSIDVVKTE
jgi:hypothetical protein